MRTMDRRTNTRPLRPTVFLVALLALAALAPFAGCGSNGSSDGGLCAQCGDDPDGPCLPSVVVPRRPDAPAPCNVALADPAPDCTVALRCLRKLGSAQRRCFPFDSDPQFRCDGERANPSTLTPLPATPSPTTTPIRTVTPTGTTPNPMSTDDGETL